jgi:hypothetical protein
MHKLQTHLKNGLLLLHVSARLAIFRAFIHQIKNPLILIYETNTMHKLQTHLKYGLSLLHVSARLAIFRAFVHQI